MNELLNKLLCRLGWHRWSDVERLSVFEQDYHDTRVCVRCRRMQTPLHGAFWMWTHANEIALINDRQEGPDMSRRRSEADYEFEQQSVGIANRREAFNSRAAYGYDDVPYFPRTYVEPSEPPKPPKPAGMILADFVELLPQMEAVEMNDRDRKVEGLLSSTRGFMQMVRKHHPNAFDTYYGREDVVRTVITKVIDDCQRQRFDAMVQHGGTLPAPLLSPIEEGRPDALARAAASPKISLKEVRAVSDKLGFIVTPFEFLDARSYKDVDHATAQSIKAFGEQLSAWFDIYVIAPPTYYDLDAAVRSESDLPVYTVRNEQAFLAVSMTLPTLRALTKDVNNLRGQSNNTTKAVAQLQTQLANLEARIEQQQREQARVAAEQAQRLVELEAELARSRFMSYEPMMLAIPKGTSIYTDGWAVVGPCWGPDFPEIAMTLLGFQRKEGQRDALKKLSLGFGK
jgi:hypothetical protein